MGTNYYARIIPTKERKEQIKKAIDDNDFDKIKTLVNKTYSAPHLDFEDGYVGGEIHLGKRSSGWKFLWNPNWYKQINGHTEWEEIGKNTKHGHWVEDGYEVIKYYELTKKSIQDFINREDIEIYDEYGEKQNKKDFWEMTQEWGYNENNKNNEGWDGETYEQWEQQQNPNRKSHLYETEYAKFIKECGYKVNKYNTDFYSDGLRFATCTDFC